MLPAVVLIPSTVSASTLNILTLVFPIISVFLMSLNGSTLLFNADSSIFVSISMLMSLPIVFIMHDNFDDYDEDDFHFDSDANDHVDVDDEDDFHFGSDSDANDDVDVDNVDVNDDYRLPKLPISIFTCKTLVSLDLYNFSVEGFSFSSTGFGFPSLKTLWLSDIYFAQDRDFILLLLGCPVLEDLKLFHIYLHYDEEDSLAIQQFKSLSLPKLIRADITRCECYYFLLKVLSISESLCLDIFKLYTKDSKVDQESYSFAAEENEEDDQENWVEPEFVPQCLLSHLRTCTIIKSQLMMAKYILKNAIFLQSMTISSEWEKRKLAPARRPLRHVNF